ncbi:MAG: hypothetical protein ACAI44_19865 [Candidatus Sericytochromatia bacterium]
MEPKSAPSPGFVFWTRWLLVLSVGMTGFGVLAALWPMNPLLAPWQQQIALRYFQGNLPDQALAYRSFIMAPLGGTIAGFYLMQTLIVAGPFARRDPFAWHAVCWGSLLWFGLDSTMSLLHGAAFNVLMINLPALLGVGLPLALTYGQFSRPRPA